MPSGEREWVYGSRRVNRTRYLMVGGRGLMLEGVFWDW
jgi:hypothetical protein